MPFANRTLAIPLLFRHAPRPYSLFSARRTFDAGALGDGLDRADLANYLERQCPLRFAFVVVRIRVVFDQLDSMTSVRWR